MIEIAAPLFNSVLLILIMFLSIMSSRAAWKTIRTLTKRIAHLYAVIDILVSRPGGPPILRKILALDPEQFPLDKKGRVTMMSKLQAETYQDVRASLLRAMEVADEEQKQRLQVLLQEFDSLSTMLSTVDENSSDEYIEQITSEIPASMERLAQRLSEFE